MGDITAIPNEAQSRDKGIVGLVIVLQRKVPKFSNRVTLRERSSATEGSRFVNSKRFFAVAKSAAAQNDTPKRQHCAVILRTLTICCIGLGCRYKNR